MDFSRYKSISLNQTQSRHDEGLRVFFLNIYQKMFLALLLTGLVAFATSSSPQLMHAIFSTPLAWVVMLAPLGMVIFLSARIMHMSISSAQMSFWIFAALMGLSLSTIFIAYTSVSVAKTLFITASVFGAMSLVGYTTKRDLTGFGSFLMMGLIGIILASLVNLFLKSPAIEFVVSGLGVVIFVGLTAYDTQKLKRIYFQMGGDTAIMSRVSIMGALTLYMDFINLFLMLLRFMGNRR